MTTRILPAAFVGTLAVAAAVAQTPAPPPAPPPATDVFLITVSRGEGIELGKPVNVTSRPGYDNQPCFLPDGRRLVYTSIGDDGQADIWSYDLETKKKSRVTETAESEYSPTPIPGEDAISVVRVEAGERQRLWRFPLDGGKPDLLLPNVEPVGYHAWSDAENLALFVLGEPNTLRGARRGDGPARHLADGIGRALHRVPGSSAVAFVHKEGEGKWTIKKIDLASGETAVLTATRPGREDFTFSPSGELWMGDGSALYVADPGNGRGSPGEGRTRDWKKVADFGGAKVSSITRIAFHPKGDRIAFVAVSEEQDRPRQSPN